MSIKTMSLLGLSLYLYGCAVAPQIADVPMDIWADETFAYDASLVSVSRHSLFELAPELLSTLRAQGVDKAGKSARLETLTSVLLGPQASRFAYVGGHSTVAAETWRKQSGDCLSLTVLSYSLARALDLPIQMQEVRVPVSFDRHGGVNFLNGHVNALIRTERPLRVTDRSIQTGDIVIDFEPQIGSRQKGVALNDDEILARYFNNIASEYLALDENTLSYAHFKAAILAAPKYAASYSNLAQLYLRAGLTPGAERLLLFALSLSDHDDLALGSLQRLMLAQGRDAEAERYGKLLQTRRTQDPYYWLGLGLEHIKNEQFAQAVDALEQAQALTSGFDEVHRTLAIAYWRTGNALKAREQLAVLAALDRGDPSVAKLSKKFRLEPEQLQAH